MCCCFLERLSTESFRRSSGRAEVGQDLLLDKCSPSSDDTESKLEESSGMVCGEESVRLWLKDIRRAGV